MVKGKVITIKDWIEERESKNVIVALYVLKHGIENVENGFLENARNFIDL